MIIAQRPLIIVMSVIHERISPTLLAHQIDTIILRRKPIVALTIDIDAIDASERMPQIVFSDGSHWLFMSLHKDGSVLAGIDILHSARIIDHRTNLIVQRGSFIRIRLNAVNGLL